MSIYHVPGMAQPAFPSRHRGHHLTSATVRLGQVHPLKSEGARDANCAPQCPLQSLAHGRGPITVCQGSDRSGRACRCPRAPPSMQRHHRSRYNDLAVQTRPILRQASLTFLLLALLFAAWGCVRGKKVLKPQANVPHPQHTHTLPLKSPEGMRGGVFASGQGARTAEEPAALVPRLPRSAFCVKPSEAHGTGPAHCPKSSNSKR